MTSAPEKSLTYKVNSNSINPISILKLPAKITTPYARHVGSAPVKEILLPWGATLMEEMWFMHRFSWESCWVHFFYRDQPFTVWYFGSPLLPALEGCWGGLDSFHSPTVRSSSHTPPSVKHSLGPRHSWRCHWFLESGTGQFSPKRTYLLTYGMSVAFWYGLEGLLRYIKHNQTDWSRKMYLWVKSPIYATRCETGLRAQDPDVIPLCRSCSKVSCRLRGDASWGVEDNQPASGKLTPRKKEKWGTIRRMSSFRKLSNHLNQHSDISRTIDWCNDTPRQAGTWDDDLQISIPYE